MMAARGRRASERAGPAGKEKRQRTWDGGWTVFHLPSTLWSPAAVRSCMYGHDFKGFRFDLVVFLPGCLDGMDRVHGASMARRRRRRCWMSPRRRSLCRLLGSGGDRTILRREEVEQHVGLLVDRLPATRLQQRPRRAEARGLVKCLQ